MLLSRHTKRREFIAALGGAAAWPVVARAQQPAMPVIGYFATGSREESMGVGALPAFHQGLMETGYAEGKNVTIEYRWADGRTDELQGLAEELVGRRVAVIVAATPTARAARAATTTIPIVSFFGGDPVKSGLVASMNRPGGNLTGVAAFAYSLGAKRFEILRELVHRTDLIAVLSNSNNAVSDSATDRQEVEAAARSAGQQILIQNASSERDFDAAFAAMAQRRASALLVMADPYFSRHAEQLVALAARHAIPAMYEWREMALAGGLMSYGSSFADGNRQVGIYTGKVLKGAKPADLPVMQAVKVELVLNLKTAKAQGITFPLSLLGRADEVIE
jgi:putative tryptophan/tyrosine transport system substrate-binding protein